MCSLDLLRTLHLSGSTGLQRHQCQHARPETEAAASEVVEDLHARRCRPCTRLAQIWKITFL